MRTPWEDSLRSPIARAGADAPPLAIGMVVTTINHRQPALCDFFAGLRDAWELRWPPIRYSQGGTTWLQL